MEAVGACVSREWKAVIDDWDDNGEFDHFHRCAAIKTAITKLPNSGPSFSTARDELKAYARQVC